MIGCSYSATRPSRSLSASNSTSSPALRVDRDLVRARRRRRARASTNSTVLRRETRGSSSVSSWRRCSAAVARSRSGRRRRARRRRATPHSASHSRVLRPRRSGSSLVLRLVQPVAARRCPVRPLSSRGRGTASPSTSSASDANIAPPSSSDVHSSWPSPVRRWWYSAARHADDREHRVRGVAHPEAVVERRVARRAPRPARTRARPTPGTAGRARRSARAGLRGRTPTCCSRRCRASRRLQSS